MKVLVVGNGGREHALAWKLLQSNKVEQVICTPGNGGTAMMPGCQNYPLAVDDFQGIKDCALANDVSLVVVGPEVPLALGITDFLQAHDLKVFGPTETGALLEANKNWAKKLMQEAGIPTAAFAAFSYIQLDEAIAYVREQPVPIVIKANGLAAGKGVTVAQTIAEAEAAIAEAFGGAFGSAGELVVIEEFLPGQEASVLALTDGKTVVPLLAAQDHKQVGEGDTGPNTGGMGAYTPTPIVTPALQERIQQEVLEPTIKAFRDRGIDYCGVVYAGLMIAPNGDLKVLEFNCRFGDPETQAILPLLETPLEDLMLACVEKRLEEMLPIQWKPGAAGCVVMASAGYPGSYEKGKAIAGLDKAADTGAIVFHAGTKLSSEGEIVTDGGRVLGVTAIGSNFDEALANAYQAVDCIEFEGAYCRRDIGYRVKNL